MRNIDNWDVKTETIPRVTIWDDDGAPFTFGGESADYGRVFDVSINKDNSSDSVSASMSFRNHPDAGPSLDPLHSSSTFNNGDIAKNLMNHYHPVKIEVSKGGGSFAVVFEGFVGDVSARRTVEGDDVINFSPYDKSKPLKDVAIIEGAPNQPLGPYVNIDVSTCIDNILGDIDQFEGYDTNFDLTLNTGISDSPQKTISKPYKPKNVIVWKALKETLSQTGYNLMFWWNGSDGFDLAIIDPWRGKISQLLKDTTLATLASADDKELDVNGLNEFAVGDGGLGIRIGSGDTRETNMIDSIDGEEAIINLKTALRSDHAVDEVVESNSPDATFNGTFDQRRIDKSDKRVRTQILVSYISRGSGNRERVIVSEDSEFEAPNYNNDSIPRTQVLKEEDKSLIDTEVEAERYAYSSLNDLTSSIDTEISIPYVVPGIQLYDVLQFGGTDDYTVWMSVSSVDYSFSASNKLGSTTIRGSAERVIGNQNYWLNKGQLPTDIEAGKGDRAAPPKPENPPRVEVTRYVDGSGTTRAKAICYGSWEGMPWDVAAFQFRYRVCDGNSCDGWQYPDKSGQPQKTITGLEVGNDLTVEVQYSAIDWENQEWSGLPGDSPYSDTGVGQLSLDITPPAEPKNVQATGNAEEIVVEWDSPEEDAKRNDLTDLNYFKVYWSSTSFSSKDGAENSKKAGGAEQFKQSLPANTERYYRITATDDSYNESKLSDEVNATAQKTEIDDWAVYGWSSNLNFTADDHQTVSWDSGVLSSGNGDDYLINPGSVTMSDSTYIYFDAKVSTENLQTTTSAQESVGSEQIQIAFASPVADTDSQAKLQVFGGQGGRTIVAEEIAANIINGNMLVSNMTFTTELNITGGFIKSDNYSGTSVGESNEGFIITADGNAEFNDIIARGNIEIDGSLSGSDITNTLSISGTVEGNYDAGSTGWKIGGGGDAYFNNIEIDNSLTIGDTASGNNYMEYSSGTLTVKGDIEANSISVASGEVQLGPNVPDGSGGTQEGLYIGSGEAYIEDANGNTIFDSDGKFVPAPAVFTQEEIWGPADPGTNTNHTINLSDKVAGLESKRYLVIIKPQYELSSYYARLKFLFLGGADPAGFSCNYETHRGASSCRIGSDFRTAFVVLHTDSNSEFTFASCDNNDISLWLQLAIPLEY